MRLTRNITSRTSATPRRSAVRVRDVGAAPLNEIGHDVMRTALAAGKALCELLDGLGLIAGRRVVGGEFELGGHRRISGGWRTKELVA